MAAECFIEKRRRRRNRRAESTTEAEVEETEAADRGITEAKGYATPSRRKGGGDSSGGGNIVVRSARSVVDYFAGVRSELDKVTWPDREESIRLTYIVLAVTVASSLALGLISFGFTQLFRVGLNNPLLFLVVFVASIVGLVAYARYTRNNSV